MEISVDYELGGYNYFTGESNPRGIYAYVKPVEKNGKFRSSILMGGLNKSGFKIFLEPLTRKSQKKIDAQAEKVFNAIKNVPNHASADGYAKVLIPLRYVETKN